MKHISYGEKTVFVDDITADTLLEYASLLGAEQTGDTVTVRAIGQDGNEVDVTFVLNMSTNMAAESTNTGMQPPVNELAVTYMKEKIDRFRNPPTTQPIDDPGATEVMHEY